MCAQALLDSLDEDLKYAIEVEGGMKVDDMTNYAEARLQSLPDHRSMDTHQSARPRACTV